MFGRKKVFGLVVCAIMMVLAFGLTACGETEPKVASIDDTVCAHAEIEYQSNGVNEDGVPVHSIVCKDCGEYLAIEEVCVFEEPSHTEKATCESDGHVWYTCTVCGYEYAPEDETTPAFGHDYVEITERATCETDGRVYYHCANCGDEYEDRVLTKLGHSYRLSYTGVEYCESICERCGGTAKSIHVPGEDCDCCNRLKDGDFEYMIKSNEYGELSATIIGAGDMKPAGGTLYIRTKIGDIRITSIDVKDDVVFEDLHTINMANSEIRYVYKSFGAPNLTTVKFGAYINVVADNVFGGYGSKLTSLDFQRFDTVRSDETIYIGVYLAAEVINITYGGTREEWIERVMGGIGFLSQYNTRFNVYFAE